MRQGQEEPQPRLGALAVQGAAFLPLSKPGVVPGDPAPLLSHAPPRPSPSPHRGAPAARLSGSSLRFSHLHPHSRLKISSENIQILPTSGSIFSPELLIPSRAAALVPVQPGPVGRSVGSECPAPQPLCVSPYSLLPGVNALRLRFPDRQKGVNSKSANRTGSLNTMSGPEYPLINDRYCCAVTIALGPGFL